MPLFSIIINKENSSLKLIQETFERFGKVITVDNGNLDEGIKSAVKQHASMKASFMTAMSNNFKEYILGITKKKYNNSLIYSCISAGAIFGFWIIYKNTAGKKNENITNQK